jgi:pantoate--beta-alanine ligase
MERIGTVTEMRRAAAAAAAQGKSIGFISTMGYLHEGSTSLLEMAREQVDFVVVSIYVNPTQFGPNEDPARYPRNLERDLEICEKGGADVVFIPNDSEIYGGRYSTFIDEGVLSKELCGASRPQLFRG